MTSQHHQTFQTCPPDLYIDNTDVPVIRPLQTVSRETPAPHSPLGLWTQWYALPKTPLMVTAEFAAAIEGPLPPLDTVLSIAAMDAAPARWTSSGEAWVVPLPLQLLGVVPIRRKNSPNARIPVWASTNFLPTEEGTGTTFESLCIGHEETVRALLKEVTRVGQHTPLRLSVRPVALSIPEAEEAISENRPLPEHTMHFAPPYKFDWSRLK